MDLGSPVVILLARGGFLGLGARKMLVGRNAYQRHIILGKGWAPGGLAKTLGDQTKKWRPQFLGL